MRKKRYSQSSLLPIGKIIARTFKSRDMTSRLYEMNIAKIWSQAAGRTIAAQTMPDGWREGTLFVRASSSVWVQQLHFMKDELRRKINELSGKTVVRDIRFAVGYQPDLKKSALGGVLSPKPDLSESDKKMIEECVNSLSDPELASIIKRVMEKEISLRPLRGEKKVR